MMHFPPKQSLQKAGAPSQTYHKPNRKVICYHTEDLQNHSEASKKNYSMDMAKDRRIPLDEN